MTSIIHDILEMRTPFNMMVMIALIFGATGMIGSIAAQIRKFAVHTADLRLKRDLVERGLNAEEIERIINTQSRSYKSC